MTLKRRTKIPTWNILCRWAFCVSIAEPTPPHAMRSESENPIEMTWKTFAGAHEGLYMALLRYRCHIDDLDVDEETLQTQLRLHIHRGISYLAGDKTMQSVQDLLLSTNFSPLLSAHESKACMPSAG